MDIRLALMAGIDIPIPECQLILHQPTIREIAFIGEKEFFIGLQTLCLSKSMFIEDKDVLNNINNFQIFMTVMQDKSTQDKKQAVLNILNVVFPKYKVLLTPNSLLFQESEGTKMVDERNFDFFQNIIKEVFCQFSGPMDQQAFNPGNAAAKEIADKLMRGRQRVAAQKGGNNGSIFSQYLSILNIGLYQPIEKSLNLTMYQIYDLIERYSLYMSWDIDIRSRLAGGKPDSQPENWMKNIH